MSFKDSKELKEARKWAYKAISNERKGKLQHAISYYQQATKIILQFLKSEVPVDIAIACQSSIYDYINRAKELKLALKINDYEIESSLLKELDKSLKDYNMDLNKIMEDRNKNLSGTALLKLASEVLNNAVLLDHDEKYELAIFKYVKGINLLTNFIKGSKNKQLRKGLKTKIQEYIERIEFLENKLKGE